MKSQTYPEIETVVVDNWSRDTTAELARSLATMVLSGGPERSAQRNLGAQACDGDFVLFLDSDMLLSPTVVEEAAEILESDGSVGAVVIPERTRASGFWGRVRILEKEIYVGDPNIEAARVFRRSDFLQAGGYDETIHGGGEDWDLPERIAATGKRISRVQSFVIHEEGRIVLSDDLRKKFYYGRTIARYIRKHPGLAVRKAARTVLLRRSGRLLAHPILGAGLVVLKALEYLAVFAGMAASSVRPHPADVARRSSPGVRD